MSQRRNSSASGDERSSDLTDMKALAARARAQTGSHPTLQPNPAELSGVRVRRDSVIGARLTPPPRPTSGQLPNWFWGVLGCLSVLLVGFGALFVLGQSGTLAPFLGEVAPAKPTAPVAAPAPIAEAPSEPAPSEPAHEANVVHEAKVAAPTPVENARPLPAAEPAAPTPEPAAGKAPVADKASPSHEHAAAKAHPAKAEPAASAAPAPADDQPSDQVADDNAEAKAPAPAASKPAKAAAKSAAAAAPSDDGDDAEPSAPGQDAVEAALDGLASKVRGCFVKYQIKGAARVRLVATPAGTAESVNVTGDFEDTPTGLCVEAVVAGAKLPTFKGPPLKLSQSYQLR